MMATLQERIKERRNTLGLTLLEIANLLNVKEATVQRYESGEIKNIKHDTIVELASILKCSPQYLMGWTDVVQIQENDSDSELQEYLEELKNRPEMRMLFSLAKGATKEDVEKAVKIIEALINTD